MITINERFDAATLADAESGFRHHLGGSAIGKECERELWYSFRWVTKVKHKPSLLRLFNRGHREEPVLQRWLEMAGIKISGLDPKTGKQYKISGVGGHFGGSFDGTSVAQFDIVDEKGTTIPANTQFLNEYKTSNTKGFASMVKKGVALSKPVHYAQMQSYMYKYRLAFALYLMVNKNDDEVYFEVVVASDAAGKYSLDKAERVIASDVPAVRINDNPTWYECKFCDFRSVCQLGTTMPEVNCRTCAHSTPVVDRAKDDTGEGTWHCAMHNATIPKDAQVAGCPSHQFHPHLLDKQFEYVDADVYRTKAGAEFRNAAGADCVPSVAMKELL